MAQSKLGSVTEVLTVTGLAMLRSVIVTNIFFNIYPGVEVPLEANILLTAILTVFSLLEKYYLRRWFNSLIRRRK